MATPSKSQNRNVLLIGVLLMIVSLAAIYMFLVSGLHTARTNLATTQAKLSGLETDIDVLTTAQNKLDFAEAAMTNDKKVDFGKIPLVYPKTEDVTGLYLQLEALMSQAIADGISLPAYTVSAPLTDTDGSIHIPVSVSGTGSYVKLKTFLANLEDNLRPLTISTINLAQTIDKDKGTPNGAFTLNVASIVRAQTLSSAYTSGTAN
jgi:uncharacterized protein YoxC